MNKDERSLLQRYTVWGWGLSFKIMLPVMGTLLIILAPVLYLTAPNASDVTLNLGGYSQGEAAAILLVAGIVLLLVYVVYKKLIAPKFANYKPQTSNSGQWFK